jgi:hypothetical protein
VTAVNDPPVAVNDTYSTAQDTTLTVTAPGVLTNDSDVDGDALSAVLVADVTHGTLALNSNGSFTYVPAAGFSGTDSFTYTANDGAAASNVATAIITVGPGANDVDMYLAKMKCTINWACHAAGINADRLYITGKINPRGAHSDLTGATAALSVNGVQLLRPVILGSQGTAFGGGSYRFHLNWRRGTYSFMLKGLDLRAILGVPNETTTTLRNLTMRLTIDGANLEIPIVVGTFECPTSTKAAKISRLTFNSKQNRTLTGLYQSNLTQVWQRPGPVHSFMVNGAIEAEGGGAVNPTGDITVKIGTATLVMPFAQLVTDGTDWSFKGASPGIVRFVLRNSKHVFVLSAWRVADTGIPLASQSPLDSHHLQIQLQVPTVGGVMIFDSIVEILRPSSEGQAWRR